MEQLFGKLSLIIHIIAGASTLIAGPVAIFYNFKDARKHRLAGKVFFYAMLVVCVSSWMGYVKRPDQPFFQFLLGVAMIVLASVLRKVRAIQFMKNLRRPGGFDIAYTVMLGLTGMWLFSRALWHFEHGTMIALPILLLVFGVMALSDTVQNCRLFLWKRAVSSHEWYRLHVGTMLGAFTASTTAFTVNAATFLPWYLQWFGPALAIIPLQIYFGRKLRRRSERVRVA
ncbi:MAG: hypothetical protein U0U46_12475 [Saprospiraceae bacterium]